MRVDGDTPIRQHDPARLSRTDSPDPTGDKLLKKIVACGTEPDDPPGTLWLEAEVHEYLHDERGTTRITLDLGHSCTLSFTIMAKVIVPKFIRFKAVLELEQSK